MDIAAANRTLRNLGSINVIMGKNGCGKSRLLRHFDEQLPRAQANQYLIKYISPERGGSLTVEASILNALQNRADWAASERRKNRVENFRQISVAEYQMLELTILRTMEKDQEKRQDPTYTFDSTVNDINALLDNVRISRNAKSGFDVQSKAGDETINVAVLSSGE